MPKLSNLRKLAIVCFFAAWLVWVIAVGWQVKKNLSSTVQAPVAQLMIARHDSAELPIYSKFYVSQTVSLPEPANLSRIEIPISQPDGSAANLFVSVQTEDQRLQTGNFEITPAVKDLAVPLQFAEPVKNFTVILSASEVSWKVKDTAAPRVYREKSLRGYREGKMTIAGIDKEGNIGLSVYATYTKINFMRKQFKENNRIVATWLRELSLVFLALVWPAIFVNFFFAKKHEKNGE